MARPTCKECGAEIASRVRSCPHCGAPSPGITLGRALVWLVAFVSVGVLVAGLVSCWPGIADTAPSVRCPQAVAETSTAEGECDERSPLAPHAPVSNKRANLLRSSRARPATASWSGR